MGKVMFSQASVILSTIGGLYTRPPGHTHTPRRLRHTLHTPLLCIHPSTQSWTHTHTHTHTLLDNPASPLPAPHVVNWRSIRILLECILVCNCMFTLSDNEADRAIKMACIELRGGVHATQRRIPTQIIVGICVGLGLCICIIGRQCKCTVSRFK